MTVIVFPLLKCYSKIYDFNILKSLINFYVSIFNRLSPNIHIQIL